MALGTIEKVAVTTDASGDATAYTGVFNGRILGIRYQKTDYADGVDFTITVENTGLGLWTESNVNAAKIVYPTMLVQDQVGVDTTQRDFCWCINERVKIVIASGGNAKTGTFWIYHD